MTQKVAKYFKRPQKLQLTFRIWPKCQNFAKLVTLVTHQHVTINIPISFEFVKKSKANLLGGSQWLGTAFMGKFYHILKKVPKGSNQAKTRRCVLLNKPRDNMRKTKPVNSWAEI